MYGGYFGAGSGVMMVAVLGLGTDLDLRVVNAPQDARRARGQPRRGVIFVLVADLDWRASCCSPPAPWWAATSAPAIGRRLPTTLFRVLVVLAGVTAAILMLR